MSHIHVEIWTDLVCPWCLIGKRRFEAALAGFEHRDEVRLTWRAFELDPDRPRVPAMTIPESITRARGYTPRQAADATAAVTALAAELGLAYRLDLALIVNSFDAHRLMRHAETAGCGEAVRERLMTAYTCEGANLADHTALADLAAEAGLDRDEALAVLARGDHAEDVRADEERGHDSGVTGVPTFVFADRYAVAGAQPVEVYARMLRRARETS